MTDIKKSMTVVDKTIKALNKATIDNSKSKLAMNEDVLGCSNTVEKLATDS